MAIFEKIDCHVTIDGQKAPEYLCSQDHDASVAEDGSIIGPVVENYIESQPNQNFAIEVRLPKGFSIDGYGALSSTIFIDGTTMARPVIGLAPVFAPAVVIMTRQGAQGQVDGRNCLQKFRFQKLMPDESHIRKSDMDPQKTQHLGEIKIELRTSNYPSDSCSGEGENAPSGFTVSESHAKGRRLDAFTSLDAPIPKVQPNMWRMIDVSQQPLVTFIFHYRGRKILQQLNILETPLSERALEDRDPSDLTLDEMRELLRRKEKVIRQQEDTEKLMKRRLRESDARRNLLTLETIKRVRSLPPGSSSGNGDDEEQEVQIVKRAKKDRKIEIVELD